MSVKNRGQVPAEPAGKAIRTEIQWLIDKRDGAPNFEMRKFTIKAGGKIPKHYHKDIEHEQYVLSGRYVVGIGDKVYEVKQGDSLYIPAGTVHWYTNTASEDAEFICVIPRKEKYDAVYLEEEAASSAAPADSC
jgi:quercetin dioxygenase-like cupin family protein